MLTATTTPGILTIGEAARTLGVPLARLRRLYVTGRLPEPARLGVYRVVMEAELPAIREALARARGPGRPRTTIESQD
jgi:hypothetical protein